MTEFIPVNHVENSQVILDSGIWPNFHDAEVHHINLWRGDVRPEDNIWIGPVIDVSFELCALQYPYIAVLRFHDCDAIRLQDFNQQNALYDLSFVYQSRGLDNHGNPLTPFVQVNFEQAFGAALSFSCFRVQALERRDVD